MADLNFDRRTVLGQVAGLSSAIVLARQLAAVGAAMAADEASGDAAAAAPAADAPPARKAFGAADIKEMARQLATTDFAKPTAELPAPFDKLSYDQYRDIRFKTDQALWNGDKLDFQIQLFPMGWLYESPVEIWTIENGEPRQLKADGKLFSLGPLIGPGPEAAPFGFSGLRIHGPINRADYFDEYVVFQGASYLRSVGRGQQYGASARGLALNTARPGGEEFPFFRAFWIEKPAPGAAEIIVHALLDSPSVAGAYRFAIQPGEATVMDVELSLYPRKTLVHVGIAPLTSMFLHGPADDRIAHDFRPSVHDSEGLAVFNGNGERLWRPLTNPKMLQTSAFLDKDPKGFGLAQRDRSFQAFEDLEARYDRRPTVWVEPKGGWGAGYIELIEIPVEEEIHDNIVAYWKPEKGLEPGSAHDYAYRLHWSQNVPAAWTGARVAKTRIGQKKKAGTIVFVVDFDGPAVKELRDLPVADLSVSPGESLNLVVQRNPELSGIRVTFEMNPGDAELVELRLAIKAADQLISESWLYRWTKP
ncbi:MAG: glucan biosynthesis protein [Hyphomicrobium sp.]